MGNGKVKLNKFLFKSKEKIHVISLLISIIALFIVFLNIIRFNLIFGINPNSSIGVLILLATILSTIFIILFIPTYPLIFIINREKKFNFLEKLGLTIVLNLCFFIFSGYIGFLFGIPITCLLYTSPSPRDRS